MSRQATAQVGALETGTSPLSRKAAWAETRNGDSGSMPSTFSSILCEGPAAQPCGNDEWPLVFKQPASLFRKVGTAYITWVAFTLTPQLEFARVKKPRAQVVGRPELSTFHLQAAHLGPANTENGEAQVECGWTQQQPWDVFPAGGSKMGLPVHDLT